MKKAILVNKSGETEQVELSKKSSNCISKCLKIKGKGKVENIHNWKYNDLSVQLYGFSDGKAGDENKFELPPPVDSELFFGDMLFISCNKEELNELTLDDFIDFYNETMGGFEDIESSSEEDGEEGLLEYKSSEDSDWKPGSTEESSSDEEFEGEEDEEYEEDEEEDTEDIILYSSEEDGEEIEFEKDDTNSGDSVSILLCNYDNKDDLDEILSSSADSELSEDEIDIDIKPLKNNLFKDSESLQKNDKISLNIADKVPVIKIIKKGKKSKKNKNED
jgi:hypothetical protein